jgi:hypothetical protein
LTTVLLAWTLGVWLVWLKAHINLPLGACKESGEVPRGWRGLLHLASVMQRDLSRADIDPTTLTEDELHAEISRRVKGGMVSFETTPSSAAVDMKPDIALGGFLWQKTRELKWRVGVFLLHFGIALVVFIWACGFRPSPRSLLVFVGSWLACLGPYVFLFVGRRRKWVLWLYLSCSCALAVVALLYTLGLLGHSAFYDLYYDFYRAHYTRSVPQ